VAYRLEFTEAAVQDVSALPRDILSRVNARILTLAERPRPRGSILLQGSRNLRRLRVGAYRVIYQVNDADQVATIARVRHRRDSYPGL
jgi:mRNA interferase RelE/StbE